MIGRTLRVLVVFVNGCSSSHSPTPDLVHDPELVRRVDHLASFSRIESSHVGDAASPSPSFAAFGAVRQVATEVDLLALVRHESPVVRGYVARHLLSAVPAGVDAAIALSGDPTPVGMASGCMLFDSTVGGVVRDALCWSPLPAARQRVLALARSDGPAWAIACVDPGEGASLALGRLQRQAPAASERADLLRILGKAGASKDACTMLTEAASASEPEVRVAAAQGLAECGSAAGLDALRRLAADADRTVRRIARAELVIQVSLDGPDRFALLADDATATHAADLLVDRLAGPGGVARYAERYRSIATARPNLSWNGLGRLGADAEGLGLARSIAAAVPLGSNARRDAIGCLSRHGEAADLPELRRSLDSTNVGEVINALEAVGRLGDGASASRARALLGHPNASVVRTAAAVLARLGGT